MKLALNHISITEHSCHVPQITKAISRKETISWCHTRCFHSAQTNTATKITPSHHKENSICSYDTTKIQHP